MPLPQIIENENTVDVDIKTNLRNCNLCIHQGICSAFANFKIHVEPSLLDQKTTLKAENLAWICNLYVEKERQK